MRACDQNSQLFSFLEILASVHLARNLDRGISGKVTSKAKDELLKNRGLDETKKARKSLSNELRICQRWDQLCGEKHDYDGILCFVTSVVNDQEGNITKRQVQRLSNDKVDLFRSMLQKIEYVPRLYKVGMAFQLGIFGEEFPKRPFEDLSS